ERPHLGLRIEPRAQTNLARRPGDAFDDAVEELAVHVQPRAGRADLTGVEEDCLRRAGRRSLGIGILQLDHRRLSAYLERYALQRVGRRDVDLLTDLGRAGESDL